MNHPFQVRITASRLMKAKDVRKICRVNKHNAAFLAVMSFQIEQKILEMKKAASAPTLTA